MPIAWLHIIGGLIIGLIAFTIAFNLNARLIESSQKQNSLAEFKSLTDTVQTVCLGGVGNQVQKKIQVGSQVRLIYSTNNLETPVRTVADVIKNSVQSFGSNICLQFKDEEYLRCEQSLCNVSLTYMGVLPESEDIFVKINKILGRPNVREYEIFITKAGGSSVSVLTREAKEKISETTTATTTTTTSPTPQPVAKFSLLFVPVNWDGSFDSYKRMVEERANFLLERIPLKACPQKFEVITVDQNKNYGNDWQNGNCKLKNHPSANVQNCYVGDPSNMNDALQTIARCSEQFKASTGKDYDFAIGIDDSDIEVFEGPECSVGTQGWSDGFGGTNSVIVEAIGNDLFVATHEISHEFNLREEYCDCSGVFVDVNGDGREEDLGGYFCGSTVPTNPLKSELGCNTGDGNGCCFEYGEPKGQFLPAACGLCFGNLDVSKKGTRSLLSTDFPPNFHGGSKTDFHDQVSLDSMSKFVQLQC